MNRDKKYRHLTLTDRLIIKRMLKNGFSKLDVARATGFSLSTIYYELKRGEYEYINDNHTVEKRYSPHIAHERYRENLKKKGQRPKIASDEKLKSYIEDMIVKHKYSPEAIILKIKEDNISFQSNVKSINTIYSAIKNGYIDGVTLNLLPRQGRNKKRKRRVVIQKRAPAGTSIEKRNEDVLTRASFGNWEMDCVVGKLRNKKTLLVFTERKTRFEIIEVLRSHTTNEVVKALNRIEKRYGADFYKVFNSITVDNGSEFKDFRGMEQSIYRKGKRTQIYYCHPQSPHERGSNENNNHLIRRFFSKGADFDSVVTRAKAKAVEDWMNEYPRPLFGGACSYDLYMRELDKL